MKTTINWTIPFALLFLVSSIASGNDNVSWPALAEYTVDSNFGRTDAYPHLFKITNSTNSTMAIGRHVDLKIIATSDEDLRHMLRILSLSRSPLSVQIIRTRYDFPNDRSYKVGFFFQGGLLVAQNKESEAFVYEDPLLRCLSFFWLKIKLEDMLTQHGLGCECTAGVYTVNDAADFAAGKMHGMFDGPNPPTIIDGECGSSAQEQDAYRRLILEGPLQAAMITQSTFYIRPDTAPAKGDGLDYYARRRQKYYNRTIEIIGRYLVARSVHTERSTVLILAKIAHTKPTK